MLPSRQSGANATPAISHCVSTRAVPVNIVQYPLALEVTRARLPCSGNGCDGGGIDGG